jgi:hypothetical protein
MERRSKLGRVERRKILMPIYKFRVSTKDLYILNILPTYFLFFFLDNVISLSCLSIPPQLLNNKKNSKLNIILLKI